MDSHPFPAKNRPVRWSTAQWCRYYRANAKALLAIPWDQGVRLTPEEHEAIAASLQDFQLGESSEGHNLVRAARHYAAEAGDERYEEAIHLFIAEEQRHAHDLGRFLTLAGIPLLNHTWRDVIFRWLRRRAGLELFLMVLVTAEMIGKVYYKALRRAIGSLVLRRLCDQLLRDEIKHIRFHVERLALMRQNRQRWRVCLARAWHRILFGGTCLIVWQGHRRALRAGDYTFGRFWSECWEVFNGSLRPIDPRDLVDTPLVGNQTLAV
jgi:hypothetical protein